MSDYMPFVSIIIPTHNSEKKIGTCLESIFNLNYPKERFEVILVDDSEDRTKEIARRYNVKYVKLAASPGAKRNYGAKMSNGSVLAFIDDDCSVTKEWLSNLVKALDHNEVAEVGGPNLTPNDDPIKAKCAGYVLSSRLGSGGIRYGRIWEKRRFVDHNPSCNIAVKRNVYFKIGGFREDFWPSEDVEFDNRILKAGYKILYEPSVIVYHRRKSDLHDFFMQIFRYGRNRVLLSRIDKSLIKTVHFMPSTVIITCIMLLGFGFTDQIFWYLLGVLSFVYFVIFELYALRVWAKERDYRYFFMLPVTVMITHVAWGTGFLWGLYKAFTSLLFSSGKI